MLLKKEYRKEGRGRSKVYYLIKCEKCGNEQWYSKINCDSGKKRFCSKSCATSRKRKPRSIKFKQNLSKKNSGVNNPFYGKTHSKETKEKIKLTADSWNKRKNELTPDEWEVWYANFCANQIGEKNGFYGKSHSLEARSRMSIARSNNIASGKIDLKASHRGIKGKYHSNKMNEDFFYDSFYELVRMKVLDLDDNIVSWTKRHNIRIPYSYDGYNKHYIPDFFITHKDNTVSLEEVKGYEISVKKQAKFETLEQYCIDNKLKSNILERSDIENLCKTFFNKSLKILREEFKNDKFK